MKKTYMKPILVIESFQLDAAVAASCSSQGFIPIGHGENTCIAPGGFFNYQNCEVDLTGVGGDENDTPCYHGPTGAAGLTFISS